MNEVSLKPVIDELETLFSKFNNALPLAFRSTEPVNL